MSNPPLQGGLSGSVQTLAPRNHLQPSSDPSAFKRVCFYKSGDPQFGGHRMVINARTFKTFDALLDALSQKVPLPFGVRTITSPRGIHAVRTLDQLLDGGSYVCSDQKRVKPLNLDMVNRRQVPWNATRSTGAGRWTRRGAGDGPKRASRPAGMAESRVAVRTPKRLVVFKNRDPSSRHIIVLHRRTAPTFDALLDYLSQVMKFPVLKLYTQDGRRVDGLPALILCSGVVVASGNEPFRPRNYDPERPSLLAQTNQSEKNKSFSSGTRSRNFSISSERHFVNQINKSLKGSSNSHQHRPSGSVETDVKHRHGESIDTETCVGPEDGQPASTPQDGDIEKSFRVNPDGSMTVEMKVCLTIKEKEMIHWTTTLSRANLSTHQRAVCPRKSGPGNVSPDNNALAENPAGVREENRPTKTRRAVAFSEEGECNSYSAAAFGKNKSSLNRTPTPGPRHVTKASIESLKLATENGAQESTLGTYSYMESTVDGKTAEGYCVVRQSSSSSSSRPVPKPRKTGFHSRLRTPEEAELQNDGMGITETVMHVYRRQGCYDNHLAHSRHSVDDGPEHDSSRQSKPASTDSGSQSSSNDCDVDLTRQSSITDSQRRWKGDLLSLSSEPMSPAHKISNNLSSFTDNEAHAVADSQTESSPRETERTGSAIKEIPDKVGKKRKTGKAKAKQKTSTSLDKKEKDSAGSSSKSTKQTLSSDKPSNVSSGKKIGTRTESGSGNNTGARTEKGPGKKIGTRPESGSGKKIGIGSVSDKANKKSQKNEKWNNEYLRIKKKVSGVENTPMKKQNLALNIENIKEVSSKKQLNVNQKGARDSLINVNTPDTVRPAMNNMLDILPPQRLVQDKKMIPKQKSMNENRKRSPKHNLELSESVSMPALPSAPSDVHQYVENWLEKINPESAPYMEEAVPVTSEPETKVVFQIGYDSESEVCRTHREERRLSHGEADKSISCQLVPVNDVDLTTSGSRNAKHAGRRGLCTSMPSVQNKSIEQESRLWMTKSAEAIAAGCEASSSSSYLSPTETITPVLRQLCSSIRSIRGASRPEKSHSLPDFSTQVASVFGSSSKALLSFLSLMTLRDMSLKGSMAGAACERRSSGIEALLVVQSLQKFSTIDNEEGQRASLADLQSRTSSELRQSWKDFRERDYVLEGQNLSSKFSEREFVSEAGDDHGAQRFDIEELMKELDMPRELREELTSLVDQNMYPLEPDSQPEPESTNLVESAVEEEERREVICVEPESDNYTNIYYVNEDVSGEAGDKTEIEQHSGHRRDANISEIQEPREGTSAGPDMTELNVRKTDDLTAADNQQNLSMKSSSDQDQSEAEVSSLAESVHNSVSEKDTNHLVAADDQADQMNDCDNMSEPVTEGDVCGSAKSVSVDGEDNGREEGEEREGEEEHEDKGEEEQDVYQGREKVVDGEDFMEQREEMEDRVQLRERKEGVKEEVEEEREEDRREEGGEEREVEGEEDEEEREGEEEREDEREEETQLEKNVDEEEVKREGLEPGVGEEMEEERGEVEEERGELEEEEDGRERLEEERGEVEEERGELEEEERGEVEEMEGIERSECEEKGAQEEESEEQGEREERVEELDHEDRCSAESDVENSVKVSATTNILEEACYIEEKSRREEGTENTGKTDPESKESENGDELCQCRATDTENELKTNKGEEEHLYNQDECREHNRGAFLHPVEISQELIDFINSALQSSSLTFTYDSNGNLRIEPDSARIVPAIPKTREDSQYGLKRLPSPNTSDLSDYRPETSESGGRKTDPSLGSTTESEDKASEKNSHTQRSFVSESANRSSKPSPGSKTESLQSSGVIPESQPSQDSGAKASGEDLSRVNARSSSKPGPHTEADSDDGVLIDQGRWLLKENHLIRRSPPPLTGMYDNLETSSADSAPDDGKAADTPPNANRHAPLAAISSSELEEMARPPTPRWTYFNMSHGSDSDPFEDDPSVPRKRERTDSQIKRDLVKVSPTVDTSKTWPKKNGSMSSFPSVEFKMADSRVHPEADPPAQPSRSRSAARRTSGSQDSLEPAELRCGQYCPIL